MLGVFLNGLKEERVICKSLTYALTFCMQKGAAECSLLNQPAPLHVVSLPPWNVQLHVKSLMSACPAPHVKGNW